MRSHCGTSGKHLEDTNLIFKRKTPAHEPFGDSNPVKRGSIVNRLLDYYVGIPALLMSSVFAKRRRLPLKVSRVGIMASPTLGDTLLTSAAVQDVRSHFPRARIIYLASKTNFAAAKLLLCVDEIVEFNMQHPLQAIQRFRKCKLDVLIDFTSWQRLTAFYTAVSGARYRVGFDTSGQCRHYHYDLTAVHSRRVHEVENFRSLLRALGMNPTSEPKLNLASVPASLSAGKNLRIMFHPWASGDLSMLRQWPLERWVALAQRLDRRGTEFIVTGSPAQREQSAQFCRELERAGVRAQVFIGQGGLESLCALIRSVGLVVSVNTGVMHLAAILGAPTVAINGPNSPHRWGPVGKHAVSVAPHGGGGGFLHLGFEFKGNPTDSMTRTRLEDVLEAAETLLAADPVAASATA